MVRGTCLYSGLFSMMAAVTVIAVLGCLHELYTCLRMWFVRCYCACVIDPPHFAASSSISALPCDCECGCMQCVVVCLLRVGGRGAHTDEYLHAYCPLVTSSSPPLPLPRTESLPRANSCPWPRSSPVSVALPGYRILRSLSQHPRTRIQRCYGPVI